MSNESLFSVSDPVELLALWRLVAEAKFQSNPDDKDLWGSPYVHALAQRVSDSLLRHHQAIGDNQLVNSHRQWVGSLPNNVVLPVIKAQLRNDASAPWWHKQSDEQKLRYVRGCISPFQSDDEFLKGLIHEAEA
jgi:hypothetical protein